MAMSGLSAAQEVLVRQMRKAGMLSISAKSININLLPPNHGSEEALELLPHIGRELLTQACRSGLKYDLLTSVSSQGFLLAEALRKTIIEKDQYKVEHMMHEEAVRRGIPPKAHVLLIETANSWDQTTQQRIDLLKMRGAKLSFLVLLDYETTPDEHVVGLFTPHHLSAYFNVQRASTEAEHVEALR